MVQSDCKTNNLPYINYLMYRNIFNTEHNIFFFKPKKNQCEDCVAFINSNEKNKEILKEKYENHIMEKDILWQKKKNLKDNLFVAVYDLQIIFSCSQGEASGFYYLSKLFVYNFIIDDLKSNIDVKYYVWYESEGQRGVHEIGTCVLKYLQDLEPKATTLNKPIDVVFYSDYFCGQQIN